jgi:hypothetical protein
MLPLITNSASVFEKQFYGMKFSVFVRAISVAKEQRKLLNDHICSSKITSYYDYNCYFYYFK